MYDYIIVGSGLYGAIFAHEAMKAGKSCLVVERRSHIGGNIYTKEMEGIQVHQYGAHIFHTSNKEVWDYIGTVCNNLTVIRTARWHIIKPDVQYAVQYEYIS